MKRVLGTAVLVLGVMTALSSMTLATTRDPDPPKDGGGGGCSAVYTRADHSCPNPEKEKTYCHAGGNNCCSPQYCN